MNEFVQCAPGHDHRTVQVKGPGTARYDAEDTDNGANLS